MGVQPEIIYLVLSVAALAVPWMATRWLRQRRQGIDRRRLDRATRDLPPLAGAAGPARDRLPGPAPSDRAPFGGRVYVIDGDTVEVRRQRVRLFGMDAPELSQAGGHAARSHLIELVGGRQVRVVPLAVDSYGRIVAKVWFGDVDLSERMVRDGFARAMNKWVPDYAPAEFEARRQRRGLWAGDAANGIADPAAHRLALADRDPAGGHQL